MSPSNDPKGTPKQAIKHCPLCGKGDLVQHSYTSAFECTKCGQYFFIGVLPNPKFDVLFEEPGNEQRIPDSDVANPAPDAGRDESGSRKGKRNDKA